MFQRDRVKCLYIVLIALLCVHQSRNASLDVHRGSYEKATADQGLYTLKDDVEILTADNFKAAVIDSDRGWFVEFYNSWCGFCQRFAPSWKSLATDIKDWKDRVVVAAIDCSNEQNQALCRDYEIMAYPTLRYYHEGFKEAPKNYGFAMTRGVTAEDHKRELIHKLISEQNEGRGRQYPDLSPYFGSGIEDLLNGDVKYAVLIVQETGSSLGPELAMDLHKAAGVITRYTFSNHTVLVSSLPDGAVPRAIVVGQDKHPIRLTPRSEDKNGVKEAVINFLTEKGIPFNLEDSVKSGTKTDAQEKRTPDLLAERARQMGDVVFQMDLETVLRYSLKREVGGSKEITGDKLTVLRQYLSLLSTYFPFGRNGKLLLKEISDYAASADTIEGVKIARLVKDAENEERQVFSTPRKWLGCQGSNPQFRGYPCGLWKLFHYLTVNVADYDAELRGNNPRIALETMHGYIKNFFGCADCSQHFQEMAARRKMSEVSSFDDSILWLWNAHNEVNNRLHGDPTEDPEFPKIQFPAETKCPHCRNSDGTWNDEEVLKYLKHMYSSVNIGYLGADTKIVYLGLEGNSNSSVHEGLQAKTLQIQTRSFGEGLTNGTAGDNGQSLLSSSSSSTMAMIKDKPNLFMPLLLTILYVL